MAGNFEEGARRKTLISDGTHIYNLKIVDIDNLEHHDDPDPGHPCSSGPYYTVDWKNV